MQGYMHHDNKIALPRTEKRPVDTTFYHLFLQYAATLFYSIRLSPRLHNVHREVCPEVGHAQQHLRELGVREAVVAINVACALRGWVRV